MSISLPDINIIYVPTPPDGMSAAPPTTPAGHQPQPLDWLNCQKVSSHHTIRVQPQLERSSPIATPADRLEIQKEALQFPRWSPLAAGTAQVNRSISMVPIPFDVSHLHSPPAWQQPPGQVDAMLQVLISISRYQGQFKLQS
ncbi:hypothetical protein F1880_001988 [Penicillium rolfsii]|nr:hypothetical protein F1880_001988 [Penicillium rolfsii]